MLAENEKLLCPFAKFKRCNEKCAFYRKGVRYNEITNETKPIEACAINIIADNLEAMHNRSFMMQKEIGQTKDAMIMKTLVELEVLNVQQAKQEVIKIANPELFKQEDKKLLE